MFYLTILVFWHGYFPRFATSLRNKSASTGTATTDVVSLQCNQTSAHTGIQEWFLSSLFLPASTSVWIYYRGTAIPFPLTPSRFGGNHIQKDSPESARRGQYVLFLSFPPNVVHTQQHKTGRVVEIDHTIISKWRVRPVVIIGTGVPCVGTTPLLLRKGVVVGYFYQSACGDATGHSDSVFFALCWGVVRDKVSTWAFVSESSMRTRGYEKPRNYIQYSMFLRGAP